MKRSVILGAVATVALMAGVAAVLADARGGFDGPRRGPAPIVEFSTLDTDGDGRVTVEELQSARSDRFLEMDADGDGQVSRDEFSSFSAARAAERAGEMFDRLDTDGNGNVSLETLQARAPRMPNPERMVSRLDTNGDGAVDEAEFDAGMERFRQAFADRRGMQGHRGQN